MILNDMEVANDEISGDFGNSGRVVPQNPHFLEILESTAVSVRACGITRTWFSDLVSPELKVGICTWRSSCDTYPECLET